MTAWNVYRYNGDAAEPRYHRLGYVDGAGGPAARQAAAKLWPHYAHACRDWPVGRLLVRADGAPGDIGSAAPALTIGEIHRDRLAWELQRARADLKAAANRLNTIIDLGLEVANWEATQRLTREVAQDAARLEDRLLDRHQQPRIPRGGKRPPQEFRH